MIFGGRRGAVALSLALAATLVVCRAEEAQAQALPPSSPDVGYHGLSWSMGAFALALALAELAENDSTPRRSASYPVVTGVAECSPAAAAGLRVGDVIEKVDGRDARLPPLFGEAVNGPGAVHQLVVRRDDKLLETTMTRTKQLGEHEKPSDRC